MIGAKVFLGIDPGVKGALAFYCKADDTLDIYDMPTLRLKRTSGRAVNRLDLIHLARIIDNQIGWDRDVKAMIELAGARPGEGLGTTFDFGFGTGALHGLLAAHFLVVETVAPVRWKRDMGCPKDKDGARARATQLLPHHAHNWPLMKHDGRAEAALIAVYASLA